MALPVVHRVMLISTNSFKLVQRYRGVATSMITRLKQPRNDFSARHNFLSVKNNQIVARLFVPRDHGGGDSMVRNCVT